MAMANDQNLENYGDSAANPAFDLDAESIGTEYDEQAAAFSNAGKIALAALVGIAAGAAVGLLLAPDKGANTVANLRGKAEHYGDQLEGALKKYLDKLEAFGLSRAKKGNDTSA
jgi:hypothetical protein